MTTSKKKRYDAAFKAKVAMEAIKGDKTLSELASKYEMNCNVIAKWKKELLTRATEIFATPSPKESGGEGLASTEEVKELHAKIGQLTVETVGSLKGFFIRKAASLATELRRGMIDKNHKDLSVSRQCELLSFPRSSYYYVPAQESEENLALMRKIDEQYLKTPFYGVRRMTHVLCRQGENINRKRVRRLMRLMGLEAVGPKPRTTIPDKTHEKFPYLLRDLDINRPNMVWATETAGSPHYVHSDAKRIYVFDGDYGLA